jgi:hypothetical protein
MRYDRVFLVFAVLVGVLSGGVILLVPQSRSIGLAPYFWVLIAFALFEGYLLYHRGRGIGPPISMPTRLIGFALALGLMVLIPWVGGAELKLF